MWREVLWPTVGGFGAFVRAGVPVGVVSDNDQANHLVIRGNSPNALSWRLEGVEIVNPNHLSNAGTFGDRATQNGGGVNILSAQMLGNSDFLSPLKMKIIGYRHHLDMQTGIVARSKNTYSALAASFAASSYGTNRMSLEEHTCVIAAGGVDPFEPGFEIHSSLRSG